MPVYNGELYVRDALESLTRQTFGDFELTVSDNCSTDGTLAIVEAFAAQDPRIRVIRQARNVGAYANFRFVLDAATAEYFLWFAHDDWVEPNYLEALYGALTADPQRALAVGAFIRTRLDRTEARGSRSFPNLSKRPRVWRVIRLLHASRPAWFYGVFRTADLRRAYARAADGFAYEGSMDNLTVLPFLLNDRITGTNETVFYQRLSHSSQRLPRPPMLGVRYHFTATFFLYCLRELFESRLALWEKLVCVPVLLHYTSRKGGKFKRLIFSTMAWPVRRVWLLATGREL